MAFKHTQDVTNEVEDRFDYLIKYSETIVSSQDPFRVKMASQRGREGEKISTTHVTIEELQPETSKESVESTRKLKASWRWVRDLNRPSSQRVEW
jgi:hypothetical protein